MEEVEAVRPGGDLSAAAASKPESVQRESGYNPRATCPGYFGLMQIRYDTARAMGFIGRPNELLDADTDLTFAITIPPRGYTVAEGDPDRAVRLYSAGYYYEAKRKGLLRQLRTARNAPGPRRASR